MRALAAKLLLRLDSSAKSGTGGRHGFTLATEPIEQPDGPWPRARADSSEGGILLVRALDPENGGARLLINQGPFLLNMFCQGAGQPCLLVVSIPVCHTSCGLPRWTEEILHHRRQSCHLHSRPPHLILRRARPAFFREVVQDFRQWCKTKTNIKLGARGLQSYDDSSGAGLLPSTASLESEASDVGGEANERKVANKHCTVSTVLYSVWGRHGAWVRWAVQSVSSQRSVSAQSALQSTLESTLQKCWQAHDFCYGAEF